jgi:hypothetical protein
VVQAWVTLAVGVLASAGVIGTLWQRDRSEAQDRRIRLEYEARVEWWRRFQWAAEQSASPDDAAQRLGMAIMDALTDSPLVTASESGILDAVGKLSDTGSELGGEEADDDDVC